MIIRTRVGRASPALRANFAYVACAAPDTPINSAGRFRGSFSAAQGGAVGAGRQRCGGAAAPRRAFDLKRTSILSTLAMVLALALYAEPAHGQSGARSSVQGGGGSGAQGGGKTADGGGAVSWLDCLINHPPHADAGPDKQAQVGQSVQFSASGSGDVEGSLLTCYWQFGDGGSAAGTVVWHSYASAGSYIATVTVVDECGASAVDTAQVVVSPPPPPGELKADFIVEQLVYKDPVSGEEEWQAIDVVGGEQVELGLKVKLNASPSTGPIANYYWQVDGKYPTGKEVIHQFTTSGPRTVKLTVYDAAWKSATVTKTVHVDGGMTLLSSMPSCYYTFQPQFYALDGNRLWVVSYQGQVGTAALAQATALPQMQILAAGPFTSKTGLACSNGRLFVGRGTQGVDIYQADPSAFQLLKNIAPSSFGVPQITDVCAVGDVLYAATASTTLLAIDVKDPTSPKLVATLALPWTFRLIRVQDGALLAMRAQGDLRVVDTRDPTAPSLGAAVHVGTSLSPPFAAVCGDEFVLAATGGAVRGSLVVPEAASQPILFGPLVGTQIGFMSGALSPKGRCYARSSSVLRKWDTIPPDPLPAYQMASVDVGEPTDCSVLLFDPDGPGPKSEYLLAGYWFGFRAYAP